MISALGVPSFNALVSAAEELIGGNEFDLNIISLHKTIHHINGVRVTIVTNYSLMPQVDWLLTHLC